MLPSCPAARRVAAAAAIAVVTVCVGSSVVAAAFPPTCVPSLRKLVAISPPPSISEGNALHTPTLGRVFVWRSRSAHNHPPPPTPRAFAAHTAAAAARAVSPVAPITASTCRVVEVAAHPRRHRVEGAKDVPKENFGTSPAPNKLSDET